MRSFSPSRCAVLIAAAAAGASCSLLYDLDDLGNGTTSSGSSVPSAAAGGTMNELDCGGGRGVCLAAIPAGWDGYFLLYSTALGASARQCSDGSMPFRSYAEPSIDGANCSACACSPLNAVCTAPLNLYPSPGCSVPPLELELSGDCTTTSPTYESATTGLPSLIDASCTPSSDPSTRGPMWSSEHSLCKASVIAAGGCATGDACVDKGGVPKICIKRDDEAAACPSGWKTAEVIRSYSSGTDERDCSPCSCTPPAEDLCQDGAYEFFVDSRCAGEPAATSAPASGCFSVFGQEGARYTPLAGSCQPEGGSPTGSVVPGPDVTLCCR